jgi:dihydrofolate synthase / folylpolyglutamate synthase
MMVRSLSDWLVHAERIHPVGIDLGLDRVRRVAHRLGVLPPAEKNIVVAGTNGKGSTSVYLEGLLIARGYKVGTTLSPHLSRFNERIRLGGEAVVDEVLCDAFCDIEAARNEITLTYFEFGILAALLVFRRAHVDVTVLEVGLGGRLDAVNLVDASVTVITSIGIDHVAYLGPDRESIGAEKAGIMRSRVPCVFGEASVPMSVAAAARRLEVPLLTYGTEFCGRMAGNAWQFDGLCRSAPVRATDLAVPQVALCNAATALQALLLLDPDVPIDELVAMAAAARLPGRFEWFAYRGIPVVVDVAHNPHGATFLAAQLSAARCDGRTVAVAGFLQDKDAAGIVAALDPVIDEWVFIGTGGLRGQEGEISARKADTTTAFGVGVDLAVVFDDLTHRCECRDRIIVLGSFDVAQRARALLTAAKVNGGVTGDN